MNDTVLINRKRFTETKEYVKDLRYIAEVEKFVEQNRKWWRRNLYFMIYSIEDDNYSAFDDVTKFRMVALDRKAYKSKSLLYNNNLYYVKEYTVPLNIKNATWGYEFSKDAIINGIRFPKYIIPELFIWSRTKNFRKFELKILPVYCDRKINFKMNIMPIAYNQTRDDENSFNCILCYVKY